jgi:hypothetical protein
MVRRPAEVSAAASSGSGTARIRLRRAFVFQRCDPALSESGGHRKPVPLRVRRFAQESSELVNFFTVIEELSCVATVQEKPLRGKEVQEIWTKHHSRFKGGRKPYDLSIQPPA